MTAIETDRLVLRPTTMDDLEALHDIMRHPDVWCYDFGTELSIEQVKEYLTYKLVERRLRGIGLFSVVDKADGRVIGYCGLQFVIIHRSVDTDDRIPEIELLYGLGRDHWGKGFATEAARAMLAHGFEQQHLQRIVASVDRRNRRSTAAMRRLGMVLTEWPHHPEYLIGVAVNPSADRNLDSNQNP